MGQAGDWRYAEPGDRRNQAPVIPPQWQQERPGPDQAPRYQPQAYQQPRRQPPGPQFTPAASPRPAQQVPVPASPAPRQAPKAAAAPKAPAPGAKRKPNARAWGCLGFALAVVGLIAWFLVSVFGATDPFTAKTDGIMVVNPAAVDVTLKITNTSSSPATPTCTVDASDSSGAYSGVNEGSLSEPVQPGQTMTSVMEVTITHQGAQYVTSATVSCSG